MTFHLHASKQFPTTAVTFLRHFALGPVPTILQHVELGASNAFMRFLRVDQRNVPIFFAVEGIF